MNTRELPGETPRPDVDRRRVLHRFGLAATGLALGPYAVPLVASMRPPAAFVGSPFVEFWQEYRSPHACDGPAANVPAVYLYSINSVGFEGKVRVDVQAQGPTSGWTIDINPKLLHIQHGAHEIVRLVMDCYGGQLGATPKGLTVVATATAMPIGGGAPFVVGRHEARAECVFSSMKLQPSALDLPVAAGSVAQVELKLATQWVDSRFCGPVALSTGPVPDGWDVQLGESAVEIELGATALVPVSVRVANPGQGPSSATITVLATLDGQGFPQPMQTSTAIHVQVT